MTGQHTSGLLIVMRHAKTHLTSPTGDDFSRALTPRGSADALAMGAWLHGQQPDLPRIVSSTALRTRQTVAAVTVPWGETPPATRWEPALYLADLGTLLELVATLRDATTLLVGHNPGFEELLRYLVRDPEQRPPLAGAGGKLMPTSAVYVLELPGRRGRPAAGSAVLRAHMRPKFLATGGTADED
ncbi:MAG: histidine phosphatase family protein [Gammaproteobacteria bacterium]